MINFIREGHNCKLPKFQRGGNIREWTTISRRNPQTRYHFRSLKSIENERRRHVTSKHWYIIHPYSHFSYLWMMIMMVVFILVVPCDFYDDLFWYGEEYLSKGTYYCIYVLNVFNVIHMLVSFFTGYPEEVDVLLDMQFFGVYKTRTFKIVLEPSKIARKYILSYFVIDAIAIINLMPHIKDSMFYATITANQPNMTNDLILIPLQVIRFFRIATVLSSLKIMLMNYGYRDVIYKIAKCVIWTVITIFFAACYLLLLPVLVERLSFAYLAGRDDFMTQIRQAYYKNGRETPTINMMLAHSMMEIMQIILTPSVSFRKNTLEETYVFCLVIMFGIIGKVLIFILILSILAELYSPDLKFIGFDHKLKAFLLGLNIEPTLYLEAKEYLENYMGNKYFNEPDILNTLPRAMKFEISIEYSYDFIRKCILFYDISDEHVLSIGLKLKYETVDTGKKVMIVDTIATCMFFLVSGTVAVYNKDNEEICHLSDGQYFGEKALLKDFPDNFRTVDIIAIEYCRLYKLHKIDFDEIVRNNKEFAKKVHRNARESYRATKISRILAASAGYFGP